jgi:NAD(P)-dependent dehydrogenase (short-subunit alcohol dehydrogenase family)
LASFSSIARFADELKREEPKVDILVNNAGVMGIGKSVTSDGFETHFGVNYLGHFLLTGLLADKLVANPAGSRIVNVSDSVYRLAKINFLDLNHFLEYNPKAAYDQSKLALLMFTQQLREKLRGMFQQLSSSF